MLFASARVFEGANDGVNADFERPCGIPDTGTVKCHFGNLFFDAGLTGFTGIGEQKHWFCRIKRWSGNMLFFFAMLPDHVSV